MSGLLELIREIQANKRIPGLDEASTKQGVILPLLDELGWNPRNVEEIRPEYTVGTKKVDYSLRFENHNKAFIEVKKIGADLEKHQEQLLIYSFQQGVRLAILTNGVTWWFYLPIHEGPWERRKFYTIEIYDQAAEEIAEKFEEFLGKENVISGEAIGNAERVFASKQKRDIIKSTIPKAWNKLVTEPDEDLIELVAEMTERLSGYKPDHPTVAAFLSNNPVVVDTPYGFITPQTPQKNSVRIPKTIKEAGSEDYANTSVDSFGFQGTRYEVKYWKDVLIGVSQIMLDKHRDQFTQVLSLVGRKRPYFTRDPNKLRAAERIDDTDIFVEINVSANRIVKLSRQIVVLFGHSIEDLSFDFKSRKNDLSDSVIS